MKCKSCRRDLPANAVFCCWCGAEQLRRKKTKEEIRVPKPRQLKSGAWNIELRAEGVSVTEATEALCTAKAQAIRAGFIAMQKRPENITLTRSIDRYIERKDAVLSPSTIAGYRRIQKNRFPALMASAVGGITDKTAQAAVNAELKKGYSPKTVKNAWGFVSTVIRCFSKRTRYCLLLIAG